ncbi:PREDICTED: reticulon-4 receptor-like 2 [Nanorana parkeri]|uniref:reticulon-4 receptor-like 2 n=1 Tax=Nanorana parkeri TaxID=125878 RepID=UPI00085503BB|nr:PREDICTED: reticulon-4 receptor-like 2 [Nanorana parkeri]
MDEMLKQLNGQHPKLFVLLVMWHALVQIQTLALAGHREPAISGFLLYPLSFLLLLPLSRSYPFSLSPCPSLCTCYPSPPTASCQSHNLSRVPSPLPNQARRVFLQNNQISELGPGLFSPFTSVLWLFSNRISVLRPGTFQGLEHLEELDLGKNPYLPPLQPDTFSGLNYLLSLHLYQCNIHRLPADLFRGLHSLRYLYLQHNRLTGLPDGLFGDLSNLTQLFLYGNLLQSLPAGTFFGLSSLDRLLLHSNRLVTISPAAFTGLSSLTILFLFNNSLPSLSGDSLRSLPSLQFLRLNGNPWHCDCSCRSLWGWFRSSPGVSSSPVTCSSPPALRGRDLRFLEERDMRYCTSHSPLPTGNLSGLSFPPKPSSFYKGQPGPSENEIRGWEDSTEEGVDGEDIGNGANGSIRGLGIILMVSVLIVNVEIDV